MARKRRVPSPPPPPPQEEESSSEDSDSEEEEEEEPPRLPAQRRPPQAAANNDESSEESESDSDTDAQSFQVRQVLRSPTKPTHPATHPESVAEEEEGESSESEHEIPVPVVQKKAAAAAPISKTEKKRKRPASDLAPTGKAKRAKDGEEKTVAGDEAASPAKAKKGKAELEKPAPDATPAGKAKKDNAQKAAPEATPSRKVKKGGDKLAAPVPSPSGSKSVKPVRWLKEDEMTILVALAAHVKSAGKLPKTDLLLASVRDRLVRTNCSYSDIYEKVRRLRERYEKAVITGVVPSKEDGLQMHNLSEAIWGEKAREAGALVVSKKGGAVKKGKGQANKEKMDGNAKGGAAKEAAHSTASQSVDPPKGSKKGHARLSEEATTTVSPSKSKKQGTDNEELYKDGGNLAKGKEGKTDKGKMDIDTDSLKPKETINANQNARTHDEETERDANVQGVLRSFDELQKLYPNLYVYVEQIEAHHPCGQTLKRAFRSISDEKAQVLESKIKKHRLAEARVQVRLGDIRKVVLNLMLSSAK